MPIPYTPAIRDALKAVDETEATAGHESAALVPLLTKLASLCRDQFLDVMATEIDNRILMIQQQTLDRNAPEMVDALMRVHARNDWHDNQPAFKQAHAILQRQLRTVWRQEGS
jgi:hypothetical protein